MGDTKVIGCAPMAGYVNPRIATYLARKRAELLAEREAAGRTALAFGPLGLAARQDPAAGSPALEAATRSAGGEVSC